MTELYITFFVIGLVVFIAVVLYSWLQLRKQKHAKGDVLRSAKNKLDDPLFVDTMIKGKNKAQSAVSAAKKTVGDSTKKAASFTRGVIAAEPESSASAPASRPVEKESKGPSFKPQASEDENQTTRRVSKNRSSLPVVDMANPSNSSKSDAQMANNVEIIDVQPRRDEVSSSIVTELVARVKNVEPIEQKELLSLFRNHDFKFNRRVHFYGLNQLTDMWRDIEYELPSARFVELGISIQLADRDGPMSEKELHDFQQMVLEFSNSFDALFEFSMDIDEALIQAKVLDQLGRRYDSMAVLNVVPRSKAGFRSADIESCARDLGLARNKKGIFLKTTGHKNQISVLYRLACTNSSGNFGLSSDSAEAVHDLVMYMNVPATKMPEIVFQDMVKDTNSLATWLDGRVVDREGKVMTQRSYSVLTQQISDIVFSMQQDGLVPGDELSKKLF